MRTINVTLLIGALLLVAKLPAVADGKVFAAKCASCHGKDGKGNPAMAKTFKVDVAALDLTDKATLDKADGVLTKITMDGSGKMPAYKGKISDADIASAVAYIRELSAGGATAAASPAGGAVDGKVYAGKCASCHGKDGKGNPAMAKTFKVDNAALDLTDGATLGKTDADLIKVTADGVGKMPAYKGKISDADIAGSVAYFRSLGGK